MGEFMVPQELIGLSGVDGVSISEGLRFCGSVKDFERFLDSFYLDIDAKAKELQESYDNNDIPYFAIKAHALKTSARMIGASRLSEMALAMEKAGKAEDRDYIRYNLKELLDFYRSYSERLQGYIKEKERLKDSRGPISEEDLADAFEALREVVPTSDYDAVEMILDELSFYKLPAAAQKEVDEIDGLLRNSEWEKLEEKVNKL